MMMFMKSLGKMLTGGLHNINAPGKINFVAYISTNTHITSKIIKLFKRVIFVDEIPQKTIVQLSLF